MPLDQELVDAAVAQAKRRFPTGIAGAAALRTSDGAILTSVGLETINESVNLCYETGAICEAFRLEKQVVASVCVSRMTAGDPFMVLPPCGVCQERLMIWGAAVEVAVPVNGGPGQWQAKTLGEVHPYYWGKHFQD